MIESLDSEQLIINSIDNSSIAFRLFITVDVFSIFMDSESFNGVALQGAGKYANYIPEKNKKAILKATLTAPVGG